MLRDAVDMGEEPSPGDLRSAYDDLLAGAVEAVGLETVIELTDADEGTLQAIGNGESPDIDLETATAILATDPDLPDMEAIETEARDILLMGMSIAVMDVEALASAINDELEPKEIQQKVEGRAPMTLDEYALLHSTIERNK